MDQGNYWTRYAGRGLGRRRFVGGGLALTGAAAFAAACGGDKKEETKATTAPGTPAAGQAPAPAAPQGERGGVIRGVGSPVYDSVDVHRASGDPSLRLANQVQSKLVWYTNPDTGEIEPDVAEKYEAPDAANYTFKLRQGVKWHNKPPVSGREFVADDVKWHIERQAQGKLKDGTPSADFRRQSGYQAITKIETPDKYTIKLTLDRPSGTFLDGLASFTSTIPSREVTEKFEADHRTLTEEAMVGTGPFIVTQWRADKEVLMKRNPDYFRKDMPLLDGIIWTLLFGDPNAQRAAFEQKQLDGFTNPDNTVTKAVIDAHKGGMFEILSGVSNTVFLHLNMLKQFKDIRLVQAMNMAMDRRLMIQTFHQGLGQVSGPVTWLQEGYAIPGDELVKLPGYRIDRELEKREARALWQAGGGPALGEVDVKVPRLWLQRWPDTPQIIARMFNDSLGVTQIKSTPTDYNEEIIPNLSNGNFPNWFAWTSLVSSPDPRATLRSTFLSTSSANYNKVNNPQLDKLIQEALEIADLKQAVAKTREIQNILIENAQYGNIVLYNYISRSAAWNYLPVVGSTNDAGGPIKARPSGNNPAVGYNLYSGHLNAKLAWINTKDPSYQGRPVATVP